MKTTSLLMLATAAAMIACGITSAPAQTTNTASARAGRGQFLQRIARKLDLTDDQVARLETVWTGEKDAVRTLIVQWHDARQNLRAAIHAGDANESTVRAAAAKVAAVEADLAVERLKLYGKIAPILTDEQRRKIAAFEQHLDDRFSAAVARLDNRSGH